MNTEDNRADSNIFMFVIVKRKWGVLLWELQFKYLFFILQETLAANPNSEFKLFESQQYGESDLLFKDTTQCFVHTSHMDYRSILGDEFYSHAATVFNCTRSGMTEIQHSCWSDLSIRSLHHHSYVFMMLMFTFVLLTTDILEFCNQDVCHIFWWTNRRKCLLSCHPETCSFQIWRLQTITGILFIEEIKV